MQKFKFNPKSGGPASKRPKGSAVGGPSKEPSQPSEHRRAASSGSSSSSSSSVGSHPLVRDLLLPTDEAQLQCTRSIAAMKCDLDHHSSALRWLSAELARGTTELVAMRAEGECYATEPSRL